MGWWLLWYLSTIYSAFVFLLGGAIGPRLYYGEAIAASITLGSVFGAWITYVTSIFIGSLSQLSLFISTAIIWSLAYARINSYTTEHRAMRARGVRRDDLFALLLVLCLATFLWPTYSARMIPHRDGNTAKVWTGGSCFGDLPIHMTIAESFLVGCNQKVSWPQGMESPIFSGHGLTYPFLPDWHAAVIVKLGGKMRDGFLLPGFLLASALWALLYYFSLRITRSRLGSVFSVFLVMCAGGLGGPRWVLSKYQEMMDSSSSSSSIPPPTFSMKYDTFWNAFDATIRDDVIQHDHTGEWKYLWFAFVPHIMLPQRGANFAYPAAILCLDFVWMATDAGIRLHQGHRRTLLVTAAVIAASLPLVQAHSFIGLALIIGVIGLLDFHKWLADAHLFMSWVIAGIVAVVLAVPQMSQFTDTVSSGFKGKFMQYGWLFNNYEFGEPHNNPLGLLRFWWYNLGPCVPLFLFAMFAALLEMLGARRIAKQVLADDGPAGMGKYLATLSFGGGSGSGNNSDASSSSSTSDVIGEPNPLPPAPKSAVGATRPLPATVFAFCRTYKLDTVDSIFAPLNALSPTGRAWDTLKLALGGVLVFLVSNYINFQPWDRDNAKIYYIFVFVAAPLNGAILAAPIEYFTRNWVSAPGKVRIARWFSALTHCVVGGRNSGSNSNDKSGSNNDNGIDGSALPPAKQSPNSYNNNSGGSKYSSSSSSSSTLAPTAFAHATRLCVIPLFLLSIMSGCMMLLQEYRDAMGGGGVLLDDDAVGMARWIRAKTDANAIFMHSNHHVHPSNALAGRRSLVAYYGWVSNHGYNADERLGNRDYAMENALSDTNERVVDIFQKYNVNYVLGEYLPRHARDPASKLAANEFLDGKLRLVHTSGRFQLLQVQNI